MNLRSLQYLVAVAEQRHFGNAARLCNVTQPTLSTQLKKLESYLGVQLIVRRRNEAMPTEVGWAVVALAREMLRAKDQIKTLAHSQRVSGWGDMPPSRHNHS